ncbi:glycosyltransferase [Candidatus Nitrosacidococcus tergens]|uniref:Glycosyl transferase family 2 n=1 Tax=Candidatus Nitrosacidococcus tergens TaxID=553981 RepID=A0A7G1Q7K0_9GAMM
MGTQELIDIIIPIYNAYDQLIACLESVWQHTEDKDYRLILIDDKSTDPRIQDLFQDLKAKNKLNILLLENPKNKGFVATVNYGMRSSDRDVVLLNSDTIVTLGWLDKLKKCAASDLKIGTITPFSNNGEICSFPQFCQENPVPENLELLVQAMEMALLPSKLDIPTGVGFCLYIRRRLLDTIGLFDEETFGRGYGEENDFCMRAIAKGYRNVLCPDAYVVHVGSSSFGEEKKALAEKQMAALLRKHPSYLSQVTQFIKADPIKPIRHIIQTQFNLLAKSNKLGILHVLHGHGGGTEKYARNIAYATQEYRHYFLIALNDEWIIKEIDREGEQRSYCFKRQQDELWINLFESLCGWLNISFCHIHQISGCRDGLLFVFSHTSIPYGVSLHDFFLACPTINLLNDKKKFCYGVTDLSQCQRCLNGQDFLAEIDIDNWRSQHRDFLEKAKFILAPSQWVVNIFAQYFPSVLINHVPNLHNVDFSPTLIGEERCFLLPQDGVTHIGVIGAISGIKGARNLEWLVEKTRKRKLPIRWIVIGYTDRQYEAYQSKDYVFTLHGPYQQENIVHLLNCYCISLVVFPSTGPETFCYALSDAWVANKPVLVPPIGALKERVENRQGSGWIMENWPNLESILNQTVQIATQLKEKEDFLVKKQDSYPDLEEEQYITHLLKQYYQQHHLSDSTVALDKVSSQRIYEAACLGVGITYDRKSEGLFKKVIIKVLKIGIRFRYTPLGRWAEKQLPDSWHYRLRRLLLGG